MAICLGTLVSRCGSVDPFNPTSVVWDSARFGPKICLAPPNDDPAGGGGDDDPPNDDPPDDDPDEDQPIYSEKEHKRRIEESMKRHRRQMQRDLKAKEKAIEDATKRQEEYEKQIAEMQEQLAKKAEDDPEMKGQLELQQRRFEREIAEVKEKLEKETKARVDAQEKAKVTQRDIRFRSALTKAGAIDLECAFDHMIKHVFFDDVDEDWRYRTPEGNVVGLDEGAQEYLPEYLKPAAARQGGSGTRTGSPKYRQLVSEYENEKKKLEALQENARKNPTNNHAITAYSIQKKKVQKLAQQVESTK